jgi:hypothetical protein
MIRGAPIILFMVCLAIGGTMWGASGIADVAGPSPNEDLESGGELEKQVNNSSAQDGFDSNASPNDGDLVGVVVTGIFAFVDVLAFAVLLPLELEKLGVPGFAAYPLGLSAQFITSLAFVQAASGRVFR